MYGLMQRTEYSTSVHAVAEVDVLLVDIYCLITCLWCYPIWNAKLLQFYQIKERTD